MRRACCAGLDAREPAVSSPASFAAACPPLANRYSYAVASIPKASDARVQYWKAAIIKHFREHPAGSLREATASLVRELERLLDAEVAAQKRGPR